ncbi:cyclin-dependent kinase E-1-like isoform X1 [Phoenix dactylifera]|uniref:Cyclin-dependent kinase E-1-like isoform X1 n=2 Tax=Phoenix dactylifera TaxID=42345 RepID=A0A8B9AHN0_PHODC|nr:cyclin-dependent kinase E-1-like isoform X1 [Phoenix dactylifera]XP_038982781.1 cyclin-dependent kinase E-1-like isoform X1 [Phoenix dactylifera]XP_038982783.1 cyclin-dependent kinase E-1-like isoform X1 [Phoenix dactylifera]XP_038982784.1 cyclin-dependent kinase E-1-like isoform X1 [Phoenix dactylifera]
MIESLGKRSSITILNLVQVALRRLLGEDKRVKFVVLRALLRQCERFFRMDPLPGRNALVPSHPGEKAVNYPARPVDTTTDFARTTSMQPSQPVSSGNAVPRSVAAASVVAPRQVPRPMPMVGMQRMPGAAMAAFNIASQAGMGGVNPGNIPMQRGAAAQAQQQQLRRKDPGMGLQNTGYPRQKRRF